MKVAGKFLRQARSSVKVGPLQFPPPFYNDQTHKSNIPELCRRIRSAPDIEESFGKHDPRLLF